MRLFLLFARRIAEVSLLVAAASGTLVGCSGSDEAKEYDVPHALCGISADPDVVSDLLPTGRTIKVQEKNPVPSRSNCQVNVDGKAALIVSQEWWEEGDSIADVARSVPQLESAKLTDDDFIQSGTGAVMNASSCTSADHPEHTLFTVLEVHADGVDNADATKELITAYTKAVERSDTCR
ncbi:hypothetical protein [Streptomyces sp. NPDC059861]|uniref:hypothetical protein n=1 Tax=Streptomyces sp. NPDC059861 TaxID=3346974 RepID=UPI003667DB20